MLLFNEVFLVAFFGSLGAPSCPRPWMDWYGDGAGGAWWGPLHYELLFYSSSSSLPSLREASLLDYSSLLLHSCWARC